MIDDLPSNFDQPDPLPAPAELRGRVLGAVQRELNARRKPTWEKALERGVAATLLLGAGLLFVAHRRHEAFVLSIYGPPPSTHPISELTQMVAEATDRKTAKELSARWRAARRASGSLPIAAVERNAKYWEQLSYFPKPGRS